ncbi:MAG: alpha/beta hydrolase [Pseudonocardia sp.]|nr:alpha/beta hydrolase [Pseudonocardia sp.]
MSTFEHGDVSIHYEETGSGFPVLLLAPGGLSSAVDFWERAPWNPVEALSPHFRVIAMDQRNAGRSFAPVHASDGWDTYTADQLALLDHLGVDRFGVLGMCIGGAFIVSLIHTAPTRVAAAVALQPIGLDGNRELFTASFDAFAEEKKDLHPEAGPADWAGFKQNLYGGHDVLWSVPGSEIAAFSTPILVLMGDDEHHPQSASRHLAEWAPNATLVEAWKPEADRPAARAAVEKFLVEHCG